MDAKISANVSVSSVLSGFKGEFSLTSPRPIRKKAAHFKAQFLGENELT
jgi:hypothetical protein